MSEPSAPPDVWRGTGLAALAALAFGLTAPVVARVEGSAFSIAAILYAGAALAALVLGGRAWRTAAAPPRLPILAAMVLAGAVIAPTAFAWGITRTGATTGSLLLNLESPATVLLAALVLRERISRRVAIALVVMAIAGALATLDAMTGPVDLAPLGTAAVVLACAAWGLDNVLARKLEALAPLDVVLIKCALGSAITAAAAMISDAPWPPPVQVGMLGIAGAVGYGLSLRLYLGAQRRMGAARTGSVFALAPFVGAVAALLLGERTGGYLTAIAAVLFLIGVALHATEATEAVRTATPG